MRGACAVARAELRICAYLWAGPNSLLALVLVAVLSLGGRPRRMRVVCGVLEVEGGGVTWFLRRVLLPPRGASALTLGHVVFGRDAECLERTRLHERVHVAQYERWGPLFLPAYAAASLRAWARGGAPYRDNVFEREAYAAEAESSSEP